MAIRRTASVAGCLALVVALPALAPAADGPDPVGRPARLRQGKLTACGVWYDEGVWHLNATSRDAKKKADKVIFTGRVRVEGDRLLGQVQGLEKVADPQKAKRADWVFPHADGRGFDFRFATFGKTDALTFKVGPKATAVEFRLRVGGDDDPRKVLIGAAGAHPDKADFTLPAHPAK